MAHKRKKLQSDMGWSSEKSITVCGHDLCGEVLGKLNLGDFAFLEIKGRKPTPQESVVFNAMLATLVEHGMTPMVLAARLTYLGAPEALQGAVAAGILGMGTAYAGTAEGSARILQEAIGPTTTMEQLPQLAKQIVERHIASRSSIPGIGHTVHKPIDPRTPRLFGLAQENGAGGAPRRPDAGDRPGRGTRAEEARPVAGERHRRARRLGVGVEDPLAPVPGAGGDRANHRYRRSPGRGTAQSAGHGSGATRGGRSLLALALNPPTPADQ